MSMEELEGLSPLEYPFITSTVAEFGEVVMDGLAADFDM